MPRKYVDDRNSVPLSLVHRSKEGAITVTDISHILPFEAFVVIVMLAVLVIIAWPEKK